MALGKTFAPGSDLQMQGSGQNGVGGPRGLSPQQAVKILSLRVPEALPSNAPAHRSLLTSPGSRAAGAGGLQSLIQQLIQSFKPGAGVSPMPSQSIPFPPMQAPGTGPSQNVSQQPQFQGYFDTPPPAYQQPFFGGGNQQLAGGGDFGNNWGQNVQSWANQTMQPQPSAGTPPHFDIGDLFGSGVGRNLNA